MSTDVADKADEAPDQAASPPGAEVALADARSRPSMALGLALIGVGGVVIFALASTRFGLWEPWETSWAELGRQLRQGAPWFTPTLNGQAVARPVLPVWLIALGQLVGGGSEWGMRLPFALLITAGAAAIYAWVRNVLSEGRALLAALAMLTSLQVGLSAVTLAGDGAFVGCLAIAIGLWGIAQQRPGSRIVQAGLGVALAACVLAWGWWGLALPLGVVALAGVAQRGAEPGGGRRALAALGGLVAVAAGALGWGVWQAWNDRAAQLVLLIVSATALTAGLAAAWSSRAVQALGGRAAALTLGPPLLAVALVGALFTPAAGQDLPGFAALHALLDNHLVLPDRLPEHVDFDLWARQIGFGAFPWVGLAPVALAWVAQPASEGAADDLRRGVGAWFIASALLVGVLGTATEHYLFPSIAAVAVAGALALSDEGLWARLRARPLQARLITLLALFIILIVTTDLGRYPKELAGALLTDGRIELPADFTFGRSLKIARYALMGALGAFGFGAVSVTARWARRLLKGRSFEAQLRAALPDAPDATLPALDEAIRQEPGPLGRLAAWLERPARFSALFGVAAVVSAGLALFDWTPRLSDHLSVRSTLEAYEAMAKPGEPLLTYQVGGANSSYYLADLNNIATLEEFKRRFSEPTRLFAVIPASSLGTLNFEVRHGATPRRNLHVVDNHSSRFFLISNRLDEGQRDLSPISNAILPERPRPLFPVIAKDDSGARQYAQFDGRVQLIGYELYHADEVDALGNPSEEGRRRWQERQQRGEPATFQTGELMIVRYYFKVLKRIGSAYKIFLHVDYPGTRINGDHGPVNDLFPTNQWLPGDYVVDTQRLLVEPGSSSGTYVMYMGFFLGNNRMQVTPRSAHDGSNRVKLGEIQIESF